MKKTMVIVELRIAIEVPGNYGDDCTIGQVKEQAFAQAKAQIANVQSDGRFTSSFPRHWTIMGEPTLKTILETDER